MSFSVFPELFILQTYTSSNLKDTFRVGCTPLFIPLPLFEESNGYLLKNKSSPTILVSQRISSVGFLQIKTLISSCKDSQDGIPPSTGVLFNLQLPTAPQPAPPLAFLKLSKHICIKYKFWSLLEQHSFKPKIWVTVLFFSF